MSDASCVKFNLQRDLLYLQDAKQDKFKTVSLLKIDELVKNQIEYKKYFKHSDEKNLYLEFKKDLGDLCQQKLPFRIVKIVKKYVVQEKSIPKALASSLQAMGFNAHEGLTPEEKRKQALIQLRQGLIEKSLPYEESLKLVEPIHWVHGTNSALLPMLPYTAYTCLCTGDLLSQGIAPMCGEISEGGTNINGLNQKWISVETTRDLARSYKYATEVSRSFKPEKFNEADAFFKESLETLIALSPMDDKWDASIISLLQLKQWNPELFEQLQVKNAKEIDELLQASTKKAFYKEALILELLDIPLEELKEAATNEGARQLFEERFPILKQFSFPNWYEYTSWLDPLDGLMKNWPGTYDDHAFVTAGGWKYVLDRMVGIRLFGDKAIHKLQSDADYSFYLDTLKKEVGPELSPSLILQKCFREKLEKRMQAKSDSASQRILRLKSVFLNNLNVKFSESDKKMIHSPFPLLLASRKAKSFSLGRVEEMNIVSAKWGEEIDLVFVEKKDLPQMAIWLEKAGLAQTVELRPFEDITSLFSLPLYHSNESVIGENAFLSKQNYLKLNGHLKTLLPFYNQPYPDGSLREHHGIPHAIRVAFFAAIIMEINLSQGRSLVTEPGDVVIAGYLHDTGRENDGRDLWDEVSGRICGNFFDKTLQRSPEQVKCLSSGVSEKDKESADSLEQKIIHDADVVEIMRCLTDLGSFQKERLWLYKDGLPKPLIDFFVKEAQQLIALTEQPKIKAFFEKAADPLSCLLQVIHFSSSFPFLTAYTYSAFNAFCEPDNYTLTSEMEQEITRCLAALK